MIDRNKPVAMALSFVGYHEKLSPENLDDFTAPNDGNGNYTKFARDLDALDYFNGPKNGYDWCAVSSIAWFCYSFGKDMAQKLLCHPPRSAAAGCVYGAQYFKNYGRWFPTPEVGDIIFFDYGSGINHQGIVVAVTNTNVITVEGNVNGMVQQCQHALGASYIAGYGRPCWELYSEDGGTEPAEDEPLPDTCHVELDMPVLRVGSLNWYVALMQLLLICRGYSVGSAGADGDFGAGTLAGLQAFQTANGIEADGNCKEDTWKKLLE